MALETPESQSARRVDNMKFLEARLEAQAPVFVSTNMARLKCLCSRLDAAAGKALLCSDAIKFNRLRFANVLAFYDRSNIAHDGLSEKTQKFYC